MASAVGALALVAWPVAIGLGAAATYLTLLGLAAAVRTTATPRPVGAGRRFAVLVPAHDEALGIERLLSSLKRQTYPHELFDVHVVADNCTDGTAEIARHAGAIVHERRDATQLGKGHALRWLIDQVRGQARYDAYVFFDADSLAAPDFLTRMDARLAGGSVVIQSYYRVLNSNASTVAALREAALASLHYLRPLGRSALGLSCGLKGNGMCFAAETLHQHGWGSVGLAEDVELHLELVRQGVRVDFAPEAQVAADMPTTLGGSRSQNLRWEAGRLATLRETALPLLFTGLKHRDARRTDAAIEQLIPPLSIAVAGCIGCTIVGVVAGDAALGALSLAAGAGLVGHVVAGLIAVKAPRRVYRSLLFSPFYVGWKLALYARAAMLPASQPWIRTERATASAGSEADR